MGLHSGRPVSVTLARRDGPILLRTNSGSATLSECEVCGVDRGVRIRGRNGVLEIESVEHLFAALGAWPVSRCLDIFVEGGEIPIVDGGAARFAEALAELGPPGEAPLLTVVRSGTVEVGDCTYEFEPGSHRTVDVEIEFTAKHIGRQRAHWDGSFEAFVSEIAWARTFGFRREGADLFARQRALGADASVVMVLDDDGGVDAPGAPARHTEFARHKLLDLIGDLYVFGGPPRGAVHARRPGHRATHQAVAIACERGLLAYGESAERLGAW